MKRGRLEDNAVNATLRTAIVFATAATLGGCAGAGQSQIANPGPGAPGSLQSAARTQSLVESVRADVRFGIDRRAYAARVAVRGPGMAPRHKGSTLFVDDLDAGEVRLYPATGKNPQQSGTITQGIDLGINVAVDAKGTLYVANNGNSTVTEYPLGQTSPSVTLSTSLVYPNGIAVDSQGTVYVTSGSTVGDTYVLEFPKGATSPSAQVGTFGLAVGLAIDQNDTLYVCDAHNNQVWSVAKGSTTPVNLGLTGLSDPTGAAIDPSGNLFVTNETFRANIVNGFKPGATSPYESITTDVSGPYTLAFDKKGTLYVGNDGTYPGYVSEYKANKTSVYTTFSNGIENPAGIAVYKPVSI